MFKKRDIETGPPGPNGAPASTIQARGVVGTRNNNMTDQHRQALMLIRERDAKIVSTLPSRSPSPCQGG